MIGCEILNVQRKAVYILEGYLHESNSFIYTISLIYNDYKEYVYCTDV